MRYLLSVLCSLVLMAGPAWAQSKPKYDDRILHSASGSAIDGNAVTVNQSNVVRVDVLITGTATISFQISGPLGASWYSKSCSNTLDGSSVVSTSSSGVFYCSVAGGQAFRAPITSYTSGTISAVARSTTAF